MSIGHTDDMTAPRLNFKQIHKIINANIIIRTKMLGILRPYKAYLHAVVRNCSAVREIHRGQPGWHMHFPKPEQKHTNIHAMITMLKKTVQLSQR